MPIIISLKNIEEAIDNLNYRSQNSLKSKLIRAIRNFYADESSMGTLQSIDTEELVKYIWDTGDNSDLIKTKRKNFSSIKSSVNNDLKKLHQAGKNPEGITIGRNNVFDISEQAKNKALSGFADIFREKGIDATSAITEITATMSDLLTGAISATNAETARALIDNMQNLIGNLSRKLGVPAPEGDEQDKTNARENRDQKTADHTRITKIDAESEAGRGITGGILQGTGDKALTSITDILKDTAFDARNKMNKIIETVQAILSEAIASAGPELNSEEARQIKNLFGDLSGPFPSSQALQKGAGTDTGDIAEAASEDSSREIAAQIEEADTQEIVEVIEEVPEDEAVTALDLKDIPQVEKTNNETIADELAAAEVVEIIEEVVDDEFVESAADGEIATEATAAGITAADSAIKDAGLTWPGVVEEEKAGQSVGPAPDTPEYEEIVEIDNSTTLPQETLPEETAAENAVVRAEETLSEDYTIVETAITDNLEELETVEIVEEFAGDEVEEVIEEQSADQDNALPVLDKTTGVAIEEDLRDRAEILEQLAAAAKALERIGPDLSNSIYSEEEIKKKAKFLSDEFDRYLSVREKFYNQHILIKGGKYPVGAAGVDKNALPEQIVSLREFYIGKFPVTNALFEIFVEKTGYITTAEKYGFGLVYIPRMQKVKNTITGRESFIWNNQLHNKRMSGACWYRPNGPDSSLYLKSKNPVVQISLDDACAFASWTGKRIPTEIEWEAAARTSHSYLYPWGNIWLDDACNLEKSLVGDTSPVDQYVEFANEYEVADILGNVMEWTLDPWKDPLPGEESEENYVVKGASWISDSEASLIDRQPVYKDTPSNILGFRCIAI